MALFAFQVGGRSVLLLGKEKKGPPKMGDPFAFAFAHWRSNLYAYDASIGNAIRELLEFNSCTGFGEFSLDLLSIFLGNLLFDLGRNAFNQLLSVHKR